MCCETTATLDLPADVIEMLAHYRRLLDERGWDWGDDRIELFRWLRFSEFGPVLDAFTATGDWPEAVRSVIGDDPPAGVVLLRIDKDGKLRAEVGPARTAIAGRTADIDVVVDSAADADLVLVVAGRDVRVAPLGVAVETVAVDGGDPVLTVGCGDQMLAVQGAIRTAPAAELRLSSPRCARWSVTDASGGAWFPISPFNDEGAVFLYHRLLSCRLRLAATAGTDAFLSCSHGPGVASNPPGWGRVYARLGAEPLSVGAFKQGIRAGRTLVTNGPWLSLEVNGQGPGVVLDVAAGERLDLRVRVHGRGAQCLALVGPDGVIAEGDAASELRSQVEAEPTWVAAVARGPGHPNTLDASVLAHTSPVYVEVAGRRVARRADARWCLGLLDTLERFVGEHGNFDPATRATHLGDFAAVLDQARSFYRRVAETADQ